MVPNLDFKALCWHYGIKAYMKVLRLIAIVAGAELPRRRASAGRRESLNTTDYKEAS